MVRYVHGSAYGQRAVCKNDLPYAYRDQHFNTLSPKQNYLQFAKLLYFVSNTETKMSSFWRNFNHWLHWKLSFWQLPVQPVTKISSKWRHFRFSECHWNLFPSAQLTISQHWFRQWLGAEQATSHYLNQWWPSLLTYIDGIDGSMSCHLVPLGGRVVVPHQPEKSLRVAKSSSYRSGLWRRSGYVQSCRVLLVHAYYDAMARYGCVNTWHAGLYIIFRRNMHKHAHLISFLDIDALQLVAISWRLITLRRQEPNYRQSQYWPR